MLWSDSWLLKFIARGKKPNNDFVTFFVDSAGYYVIKKRNSRHFDGCCSWMESSKDFTKLASFDRHFLLAGSIFLNCIIFHRKHQHQSQFPSCQLSLIFDFGILKNVFSLRYKWHKFYYLNTNHFDEMFLRMKLTRLIIIMMKAAVP